MPQLIFAFTALVYIYCGSANAKNDRDTSLLCDAAAHIAAREFEIPIDVLLAIARTETGRSGQKGLKPWPWTVNMEGSGYWFSNRKEALNFVLDRHQSGAVSFDIGCFQINYRWHGKFFDSIEDMFEPSINARYAARFLEKLYLEFGSWSAAAGAFHSRTPSRADTYAARFDRIRLNINPLLSETIPIANSPPGIFDRRRNLKVATISLSPLVSGDAPKLGSLFPDTRSSAGNRSIIDMTKHDS